MPADNHLHRSRTVTAVLLAAAAFVSASSLSEAKAAQQTVMVATTTVLTVAPDPSVAGQDATFTARVTADGPGTPTGTVQFLESDDTPIGEPQPLVAGVARFVAWAYAGQYEVKARYSGDATFTPSMGTFLQTVNRADTATTLLTKPNPVSAGGKLTIDIYVTTVEPGYVTPRGSISILLNGTDISGPVPLFVLDDLTAGVELVVTALDTAGSGELSAAYSGDANTNPSVSRAVTQVVSPGATPRPSPTPSAVPTATPTPTSTPVPTPRATSRSALTAMTQPLLRTLRRRGLRAAQAVPQRLTVEAPGVLSQLVYTPVAPKATSASRRPVVVARASRRFATAGTGVMRLRLTAAGRRLAGRAGKLKLQVVTTFTPATGPLVTTNARVTSPRNRAHDRGRVRPSSLAARLAVELAEENQRLGP